MKLKKRFFISVGIILMLIWVIHLFTTNFYFSMTELAVAIGTMLLFIIISRKEKDELVYKFSSIFLVMMSGCVLIVLSTRISFLSQRFEGIFFLFILGFASFMVWRLYKKPSFM